MGYLTWGLNEAAIAEQFPGVKIGDGFSSIKQLGFPERGSRYPDVWVQNFPGDCGSLILTSANSATLPVLRDVISFASKSGFSKIVATVVGSMEYNSIKVAVKAFRKAGFICAARGKSNRNQYKDDFVFVKYIRNCEYKGY
jgi:hypothetical protein